MYSSKREIVVDAFAEIGLAAYIFDLTPGMLERALRRLEAMVAEWDAAENIRIGYPLNDSPDLDDEINLPASVENALVLNLAVLIAPGHGKTLSTTTEKAAGRAFKALSRAVPQAIPERNVTAIPSGAGNKPRGLGSTFMPPPSDSFVTGDDGGPNLY